MTAIRAVLLAAFAGLVNGHGIMWKPWSRANIAEENGWEGDSTSVIAEPMPDVAPRGYPFNRPWSEPGKSKSNIGPCGSKPYGSRTNWNKPEHGWGTSVTATYKAGEIIDVEWCVSDAADHGGSYSYRLCTDESLTAKYIDPNYTPNEEDHAALEECFQRGILSCNDVPGQHCKVHPSCQSGMGCMEATSWFHCDPHNGGGCMAKGQHGACHCHNGNGALLRDKVKLPDNFVSKHTLIGFRWDCEQTGQRWLHCADVAIVPNDGSHDTPSPAPLTPAPTPPSHDQPRCDISESQRLECGYYGIDEHTCVASGCCWRPAGYGKPWCYAAADATLPSPDTQCQMPDSWRQDCGWFGVDEHTCEAKGCCWEESHTGAPWCFQRASGHHWSALIQNDGKAVAGVRCYKDICTPGK